MFNLALGSSDEAQVHWKSETVSNWDMKRRAALGVALDMVVYTSYGAMVYHLGGGGAIALFLLRLPVWEIVLAVTG